MDYINRHSGIDFNPVFAQYLTTTRIPTLEYVIGDSTVEYRWTNVVPGFAMPVRVIVDGVRHWLNPKELWTTSSVAGARVGTTLTVDPDFYVTARQVMRAIPDVNSP